VTGHLDQGAGRKSTDGTEMWPLAPSAVTVDPVEVIGDFEFVVV
jgi:hypothetical protein